MFSNGECTYISVTQHLRRQRIEFLTAGIVSPPKTCLRHRHRAGRTHHRPKRSRRTNQCTWWRDRPYQSVHKKKLTSARQVLFFEVGGAPPAPTRAGDNTHGPLSCPATAPTSPEPRRRQHTRSSELSGTGQQSKGGGERDTPLDALRTRSSHTPRMASATKQAQGWTDAPPTKEIAPYQPI